MPDTPSQRIRRWMEETISDGGVERLDDLHIDAIDQRWKDRSTWVLSALSVYRLALDIRDELRVPFKIALAFSLRGGKNEIFSSVVAFERNLNSSPPSLYLFPIDHSYYDGASILRDPLPEEIASALPSGTESRLLEFKDTRGARRRSVLIEGSLAINRLNTSNRGNPKNKASDGAEAKPNLDRSIEQVAM